MASRALPAGLEIHAVTPERWNDLESLFGPRGACAGCWCMWWRLPRKEFDGQRGDGNRDAFRALVKSGDAPGLIAYDGITPVGWCAVAPRSAYPRLGRSRVLAPVDERPVWSVTCLFVARAHRGRGVTVALLKAAAAHARARGAQVLEGYPVEPRAGRLPDTFVYTGLPSAFRTAGFSEVARRSPTRPIMRMVLGKQPSAKRRQIQPRPR